MYASLMHIIVNVSLNAIAKLVGIQIIGSTIGYIHLIMDVAIKLSNLASPGLYSNM